jgi:hypothetical protein
MYRTNKLDFSYLLNASPYCLNCTFSDLDKLLAVQQIANSVVSDVTGGTSKVTIDFYCLG